MTQEFKVGDMVSLKYDLVHSKLYRGHTGIVKGFNDYNKLAIVKISGREQLVAIDYSNLEPTRNQTKHDFFVYGPGYNGVPVQKPEVKK